MHEAVELNPTEQKLESIRKKLEQRHDALVEEDRAGEEKMQALEVEIGALEAQLPSLRTAIMLAHADLNQAQGAYTAMDSLIARLRKPGESNPVQGLEQLIEQNHALARQLAVALVGEDDADAFLKNPVIDEGTARGLVFEIKNTYRTTVSDRERILQGLIGKVRTNDPQYIEAGIHLRNAELDLAAAEARRDDLFAQIQRALETIRALQENIKATDTVARTLEQEQQALRAGNIQTDDAAFQRAMEQERLAHELLGKKKAERDATANFLRESATSLERIVQLLETVDGISGTYTKASERLAQVPTLVDELNGLDRTFSDRYIDASKDIDPTLVQTGNGVNDVVAGTMGYGVATRDAALEELQTHENTLRTLIENFEKSAEAADAPAADPKDLPWQAYEQLVASGEKLRTFLEQNWEQLKGGSVEKIKTLCNNLRTKLEAALRPFAVLQKASTAITALRSADHPTPPAAATAPAAPAKATTTPASREPAPTPPPPAKAETPPPAAVPPEEPPDDRPDEPEDEPPES